MPNTCSYLRRQSFSRGLISRGDNCCESSLESTDSAASSVDAVSATDAVSTFDGIGSKASRLNSTASMAQEKVRTLQMWWYKRAASAEAQALPPPPPPAPMDWVCV